MSDFVIETQIDKLIDLLSKRRKIALSEAARILNVKESQLDVWISTLEDNGVVELKYPVLGEPEIVLKGILPENLKIISEAKKPESKEVKEPEIKEGEKEIEPSLEAEEKEIKGLEEKINGLEKRVSEVAEELDISKLKEELFETLIIISSLNDFEKISSYLSFIERIVLVLKAKKAWDKVDKDLMTSTLKSTTENWRDSGKEDIAKIFEETAKKIEMI
jgi:hypothetical protein